MRYLDLSNNYLGYSDAGSNLKSDWCPTAWDPTTVDTAVAGSLETLDISSNAFTGELSACHELHAPGRLSCALLHPLARCAVLQGRHWRPTTPGFFPAPAGALPAKWPKLFPKLQYLVVYGNNLQAAATGEPAPLPGTWAAGVQRGFPLLKELVLYPGNENLCSLPTNDGGFRDVNLGERGRCRPGCPGWAGLGPSCAASLAMPPLPACLPEVYTLGARARARTSPAPSI